MSRGLYVSLFMLLAMGFVPVVFNYVFCLYIVPVAYMGMDLLFRNAGNSDFITLAYILVYLLIFYMVARVTFWLSDSSSFGILRVPLQVFFLVAVFSCSFVRAITYGGPEGQGGTYTFWGAVHRYFEKPQLYDPN